VEVKTWLYREGLLEASSSSRRDRVSGESEALQRSTLHISASDLDPSSVERIAAAMAAGASVARSCDVACERGVRNLPKAKLTLLEAALPHEHARLRCSAARYGGASSHGPVMGDWLQGCPTRCSRGTASRSTSRCTGRWPVPCSASVWSLCPPRSASNPPTSGGTSPSVLDMPLVLLGRYS